MKPKNGTADKSLVILGLMTSSPRPSRAYLALTLTVFLWAIGMVIARAVHDTIPPVGLSFWRWFIAGMVLLPFLWPRLSRGAPIIRANLGLLCGLGFLAIAGGTLIIYAAHFTTAINMTLVNSSQPAITALFFWLATREKLSRRQVLGLLCAAGGVMVMISEGDWHAIGGLQFNRGDLLVVVGTCFYAIYAINVPRIPAALGVAAAPIIMLTGALMVLPFYIAETVFWAPVPLTINSLAAILGISVLASSLALVLWNAGNRAVGPNRAAIFVNLLPVFGAALAIPFLGEQLFAYHFAGAALVCAGIFLVVRK